MPVGHALDRTIRTIPECVAAGYVDLDRGSCVSRKSADVGLVLMKARQSVEALTDTLSGRRAALGV